MPLNILILAPTCMNPLCQANTYLYYRKNGKARGDADGDTDGPPDREGVPMPKPPPFFIRDTCPAYTKWFEWSSPFEWYNGQICWVLNYFNKMRCPYKWCR